VKDSVIGGSGAGTALLVSLSLPPLHLPHSSLSPLCRSVVGTQDGGGRESGAGTDDGGVTAHGDTWIAGLGDGDRICPASIKFYIVVCTFLGSAMSSLQLLKGLGIISF
jgi:hypothetical protein